MRKDVANEIKMKGDVELLNKSELARRLCCDRRTVKRYLAEQVAKPRERVATDIVSFTTNI